MILTLLEKTEKVGEEMDLILHSKTRLKGVSSEMNWGSKVYSNDRHWYGTVALEPLFVPYYAAIL